MKRYTTIITIPVMILGVYFSSCESHKQEPDAFENLKNEKLNQKDTLLVKDTIYIPQIKNNTSATIDEWTSFKLQTEQKITTNELKINELKETVSTNSKARKKINTLEKDNNHLRQQMIDYIEEEKVRWETFKAKINRDASTIAVELKDPSISN